MGEDDERGGMILSRYFNTFRVVQPEKPRFTTSSRRMQSEMVRLSRRSALAGCTFQENEILTVLKCALEAEAVQDLSRVLEERVTEQDYLVVDHGSLGNWRARVGHGDEVVSSVCLGESELRAEAGVPGII